MTNRRITLFKVLDTPVTAEPSALLAYTTEPDITTYQDCSAGVER